MLLLCGTGHSRLLLSLALMHLYYTYFFQTTLDFTKCAEFASAQHIINKRSGSTMVGVHAFPASTPKGSLQRINMLGWRFAAHYTHGPSLDYPLREYGTTFRRTHQSLESERRFHCDGTRVSIYHLYFTVMPTQMESLTVKPCL